MFRRLGLISVAALLFIACTGLNLSARAQSIGFVNDSDRVVLHGNTHPHANSANRFAPADRNLRMEKIVLVLAHRANTQAELDNLIAQQHDPLSPLYHRWLTPEEFGQRFGIGDSDLAAVTGWLQSRGFSIDEVAKGRGWINFSGSVDQVEQAFQTQINEYFVDGLPHHANASDPTVPRALASVLHGVLSLHDFRRVPDNTGVQKLDAKAPDFTSGSSHYLSPTDFATIYNVKPLYNSSINGTGESIAIVGRTDINLADVTYFRSYFGLPANDPVFIHNGADPGDLGGGEETEALLDVEWSGAVGRNATVRFVISKSTATTGGVDLSAQYIVNNNVAPVMSTSFGSCESSMGTTENSFYKNLWSQAAAQGITAFVSSGDSGAAGCNAGSDTTGSGRAVSGLCSTPYNVCVGGTQFADVSNPSLYWASTNNSTDKSSAVSYIPEVAWNESATVSGGSGLWSSGGGVSTLYAKPAWQVAPGVPADGYRDVPDVALSAAGHDGYLIMQGQALGAVGGTSAASPSFAGLMALVAQSKGAGQGNANTVFYPMAQSQYAGGGAVVYHDATSGNNSVPGVSGYVAGAGYDLATGLGSVDAYALVTHWGGAVATPDFNISASPSAASVSVGHTATTSVSTSTVSGFNSALTLSATGQPAGVTVSFAPATIAAPGSGSSTMTISVASTVATGTSAITVSATGGGKTHTAIVSLTVTSTAAQQLIGNPGFENGSSNPSPWVATSGVIDNSTAEPAHSGSWKAWLDGYGRSHTDTLYQQVVIPSTVTSATLSFWLHIDTAETTTTLANDKLQVQVRDTTGAVLATLASYSNLNKNTGYSQHSFDLSPYKGRTVRIYFVGTENSSRQTSFVIDDVALNVQ